MVAARWEGNGKGEGRGLEGVGSAESEGTVSLMAEVPESLLTSMRTFIDQHPHWDQYRLVQAALAGFLVQHGCQDRAVTRCYLANLFPGQGSFHGAAPETPKQGTGHRRRPFGDPGRRVADHTNWRAA